MAAAEPKRLPATSQDDSDSRSGYSAGGGPVTDAEFRQLMAPLGPFAVSQASEGPVLAIGVSGGGDSMALAWLAQRWAREAGVSVLALTVDHGLRPGSAAEAALVGRRLAAFGIPHRILTWRGEKPGTGIQEAAREARYALMGKAMAAAGVRDLLVAHTSDDQAETVAFRCARSSGRRGLAGMAAVRPLGNLPSGRGRLLRPLLRVSRGRLRETLCEAGVEWVEDPSNDDPGWTRIRIRRRLAEEPVETHRLLRLAESAGRRRVRIEAAALEALDRALVASPHGFLEVPTAALADLSEEVVREMLRRLLLGAAPGRPYAPRPALLDRLAAASLGQRRARLTLAGAVVDIAEGRIRLFRELAAMQPGIDLSGSAGAGLWDGRFRLSGVPPGAVVVPLGAVPWLDIAEADRDDVRRSVPPMARPGLPIIQSLDGSLILPHFQVTKVSSMKPVALGRTRDEVIGHPFHLSGTGFGGLRDSRLALTGGSPDDVAWGIGTGPCRGGVPDGKDFGAGDRAGINEGRTRRPRGPLGRGQIGEVRATL